MTLSFGRVVTAMVTPMDGDLKVDFARAGELARRLVDAGSDGLVVAGTTGESPTVTTEEKLELFAVVKEAVGRRVPVIANTGSNSTAQSVALTRQAEALGVNGIMLVVPYYNKPSQEGLYRHFRLIAECTRLPVMLYNVPGRTSANLLPETVLRLSRDVPNIVAVKEASGNLDQASEILRGAPPGFLVYSGDDSLTLPMLAIGGQGVVSVASHLVAGELAAMVSAYLEGRVTEAARLHARLFPLMKGLFITANPVPVKTALRLRGFDVGEVRPPLAPCTEREVAVLSRLLDDLEPA